MMNKMITKMLFSSLVLISNAVSAKTAPNVNDVDPIRVESKQCTVDHLGAVIAPSSIGEPVSGVVVDEYKWIDGNDKLPTMCIVNGRMLPVDQSATAKPIKFAVALPGAWNRRSVHRGGSGINGVVPQFAAVAAGPFVMPGTGPGEVKQGFAAYGSDSGHGQEPNWALNDEAIRNFGYAQLKKTHDVAQILIQRMYGTKPLYRYFVGASQGGREGLTVAQRYPQDYEGISSHVPVVGLSALMQSPVLMRREENTLERWVPPSKAKMIAAEFMRQCDGLDGSVDGVIGHYMACRQLFNVNDGKGTQAPWLYRRCANGVDANPGNTTESACLTDGQIKTLHLMFSHRAYSAAKATLMANDSRSFGMWAPSTEVLPGPFPMGANALISDARYQGQEGAAGDAKVFAALGSVGITGFLLGDLSANPLTAAITVEHLARQRQLSEWLDSTNPNLAAFKKRGGKLIVAMGTNDTLASSGAQLDYYESLTKKMGKRSVNKFARLYVLPQRGHGLQGNSYTVNGDGKVVAPRVLPSQFDNMTMLRNWVEQGHAPDLATVVTGPGESSDMMCSYPSYPHYQGGSIDRATSYSCRD